MAKTPAKKTAAKKTAAKKTAAKSAPKKVAAKKVAPAKAAPKKAVAKKAPAKKVVAKKVSGKELALKKVAAPKTAAKKAVASSGKNQTLPKTADAGLLLALQVAQGMFEKKAQHIRILDLRKVPGASSDYFVISHASNDKQVEAIAKSVEDEVKKKLGENCLHREGYENMEWILIDYFNVVAHVFQEEKRLFYGIEQLWGDATEIPFKGK